MCGICGYINYGNKEKIDQSVLKNMMNSILHRGPDGCDYYISDKLGFGFTRLSMVGLNSGMQPMTNEDDEILLVCNGEIYNYIELREELVGKGHIFKSETDIEVILHLYEEYDLEFINKISGQFAFVLHDSKMKRTICARDHFGIAPLFYTECNRMFIFASEIKAILEHPSVKKEVNLVGLDQVFTFPGLISPMTMFKDIYSLENGHLLIIDKDGNIEDMEYFDIIYPEKGKISYLEDESFYIKKLDSLLSKSIDQRLRADVPIGLYLSGGLDSSLIVAKVKHQVPDEEPVTFSMEFEKKELNEDKFQNLMVSQVGSDHNKKKFHTKDIIENIKRAVYHSETPLKESYNTASLYLSEMARNRGIKAILSGEGADELFAGYVGYKFDKMREMRGGSDLSENCMESKIRESIWGDKDFFYEKDYSKFSEEKKAIYSQKLKAEFEEFNCLNHFVIDKEKINNRDILHKRSYVDFKLRLVDHLISDHCDRMTLANAVEGRYPFLDKDLIEFATKMPPNIKLKNFNEKYVLKEIAKEYLPKEIYSREKFGFVAPGSVDLLKSNDEYINNIMSFETIKRQGYFDPYAIEELKKKYLSPDFKLNLPFDSDILITVLTFGIFLDVFGLDKNNEDNIN